MPECYNKIIIKKSNIEVDCGKCLNCIENKKKEKALRLIHEMNNYKFKYFITLTMDEIQASRAKSGLTTISKEDLRAYIRSLQYYERKYNMITSNKSKMKYIACGEYGETTERAHYHLVVLTNRFIEHKIITAWKRGHVKCEKVRDARALYYTAGYTDKKHKTYFRDKYREDKDDREVAFIKVSKGNGLKRIQEAIAKNEVNEEKYYFESFNGKNRLPTYYKNKIKEAIMGVKAKYRILTQEEREYRKINFGEDRKTIMVNQNEYDSNYWKWEQFINKVKEKMRENQPVFYRKELYEKYKDNWATKLYNLLYNEEYEEQDPLERDLSNYYKLKRENLKINAEQKWFKAKKKRDIA